MYISIDVGGTNMRVALVDLEGEARIVKLESHPVPQDYQVGMEKLCGHIADLSAGQKIEGIGACFPGIIDKDNMVTTANNLPDWTMKPIKQYPAGPLWRAGQAAARRAGGGSRRGHLWCGAPY